MKYTPGHSRTYDGPWVEPTTGEAVARLFEAWEPNALTKVRSFFMILSNIDYTIR